MIFKTAKRSLSELGSVAVEAAGSTFVLGVITLFLVDMGVLIQRHSYLDHVATETAREIGAEFSLPNVASQGGVCANIPEVDAIVRKKVSDLRKKQGFDQATIDVRLLYNPSNTPPVPAGLGMNPFLAFNVAPGSIYLPYTVLEVTAGFGNSKTCIVCNVMGAVKTRTPNQGTGQVDTYSVSNRVVLEHANIACTS